MALLRAGGVPCRIHGFTINKALQKGAIPGFLYVVAPKEILHSWVEVFYQGKWINLEGIILDRIYLKGLQEMFPNCEGSFCGYGVATTDFRNPQVEWIGGDTYIQKEGIERDLGIYDSPDEFYMRQGTNLRGPKRILYKYVVRKFMNRNVGRIRNRTDQMKAA